MTMKKKILTTLSVVLILGMAVLGILAYLTDSDSDVNVMTLGNVQIEQVEQQLANDGVKEPFVQGKDLYPGTTVSKIVTVKNVGKSPAYVRTFIAFETVESDTFKYESNLDEKKMFVCSILRKGVKYDVYEYLYDDAVAPGTETVPSLTEVKLAESCTNDDMEALGDTYEILVLSQAVQTEGFEGITQGRSVMSAAEVALETAFPKGVDNVNVAPWFDGEEFGIFYVSTAQELVKVLTDIRDVARPKIKDEGKKEYRVKANIVLTGDTIFDSSDRFMYTDGNGAPLHFYGVDGNLILNGHKIEARENALLSGKAHANAVLLFQYSNVKIVGDGEIVANNKSIPVYAWANCTVDIYGGNYETNASERNESAVYVNNASAKVNVYGGTYTDSDYAFNVHDNCGNTTTIVLHEGITYKDFLKDGTTNVTDSDINSKRIALANGCELKEYNENSVKMYKVVKK